jgi:predicted amidohydrolase
VLDADGAIIGEQTKTQIAPSEDRDYVPGSGRRLFTLAGVTFGIVICHEAFRYPEIIRSLVLGGAQVISRGAGRRSEASCTDADSRRSPRNCGLRSSL